MMSRENIEKVILATIISIAALYLIIPFNFTSNGKTQSLAVLSHEDPQTAKSLLSGVPSFVIDPSYQDLVLQMNPEEVKALLKTRSFADIAQSLKQAIDNFDSSKAYISDTLAKIEDTLGKLRTLTGPQKLGEANQLSKEISARLSQASRELDQIETATKTTGSALQISLVPSGSSLRQSYDDLLVSIADARKVLELDKSILANFSKVIAGEFPSSSNITLIISPAVAFVGDNISFEGVLTADQGLMANRDINILLNNSLSTTVRTDAKGHYQGTLQVPYRYLPGMDVQAIYNPQGADANLYPVSMSPVAKLKVLFFDAGLKLTAEDKAYPGLETKVTGSFDYGQSLPLNARRVEIYFDGVLLSQDMVQESFTQQIMVPSDADPGKHIITVSSAAAGRYSPVVASANLTVTRVTPILDLRAPRIAVIPWSVGLRGKVYSELGPLSGASIKIGTGRAQVELVSSNDGSFDTKLKLGMGFGLIGSQDLVIQIIPQEPWNAPLNTTSSLTIVNAVSSGAVVVMLIFLGIYLQSRLRRGVVVSPEIVMRPKKEALPPESVPAYSERAMVRASTEDGIETSGEPRNIIFYWYRLAARFLQGITKTLSGPQVTLREFANESRKALGPAGKYFIEFTRVVERLLYSQYRPTEQDVKESKRLSQNVAEAVKE